jgi:hypothetical protein
MINAWGSKMALKGSLLDDYNRTMRRRLGHESLTDKLDAIRSGGGFRPARQTSQSQSPQQADSRGTLAEPAAQLPSAP